MLNANTPKPMPRRAAGNTTISDRTKEIVDGSVTTKWMNEFPCNLLDGFPESEGRCIFKVPFWFDSADDTTH
jgi:hypothetical protein